jgi:hypothetical protein
MTGMTETLFTTTRRVAEVLILDFHTLSRYSEGIDTEWRIDL